MGASAMLRIGTLAVRVLAAAVALAAAPTALAQDFPSRPIELVVPFGAGMAPDMVARGLAEGMGKELGQQVLVVNKPGAGGAIGYKHVIGQKADGYTLVLNSNSVSTGFHGGMMPFDYTAFDSLARVSVEFPVIAVRGDSPLNNLKDLVEHVKKEPGRFRVGSTSPGSHMHLTAVAFFNQVAGEVLHVPFATTGHVNSLLGGHIDAVVTLPGSVAGQVKAGQIKVLGVLASAREPVFENVPTATEQGIPFQSDLWRGVAAPKGLPPAVAARLGEAIRKAATSADYRQIGEKVGFVPAYLPADAFTRRIAEEDAAIAATMKKNGILLK